MTPEAPVVRASVVVASLGRPAELMRCLRALQLQTHRDFEVVVVADEGALAEVRTAYPGTVKTVAFGEANIATARNLGLSDCAAPVVAFIDDDAIPEPTWLQRLTEPFGDGGVAAAGGFVRGWTGIRMSYAGKAVDALARERPLDVAGDAPFLPDVPAGSAVITIGTNCAFRADDLRAIGGFDPAFAFHLDETDVNLRLARRGVRTAVVPGAEVIHCQAAGPRRSADRMPKSLFDIGRSSAVFLRRHAPGDAIGGALRDIRERERRRLLWFMVTGRLLPSDVAPLLRSFDAGSRAGLEAGLPELAPVGSAATPFLPFPSSGPLSGILIVGRYWRRRSLRARAAQFAAQGLPCTLVLYLPGFLDRHCRWQDGGWWEETAGSLSSPLPRRWMPRTLMHLRAQDDRQRIARVRPIGTVIVAASGS